MLILVKQAKLCDMKERPRDDLGGHKVVHRQHKQAELAVQRESYV